MNKSLTPLIIFFALVVLLTLVIVNSQQLSGKKRDSLDETRMKMKLSPFKKSSIHSSQKSLKDISNQTETSPDINNLIRKSRIFIGSGQISKAEEQLTTALVFEPNNFEILTLLGNIMYRTARYKEAEAIFLKQLKIRPEAQIYNNLGSALAKQERFAEAIAVTQKSLQLDPDFTPAFLNLSGIYSVSGDSDASIEYFIKAHEKLGKRIIPISFDPTLDNIRGRPEFQAILKIAKEQEKKEKGSKGSRENR